jgi:polyisoprenoid-binding protein YceI
MRSTAILAALILIFSAGAAAAQGTYIIDTVHSFVGFKVRHLVSKTGGEFTDFSGTIVADFENLDGSSVEFTIDAASVDTRDRERDDHLRSPDFFDVEKYPKITFKSSKITRINETTFAVAGTLTIRGVAREITLIVDFLGEMTAMGSTRAGYELTTTINRRDYGVSWNRALDAGGFVLGNDVEINIALELIKLEEKLPAVY